MNIILSQIIELVGWLNIHGAIFTPLGALAGLGNFVVGILRLIKDKRTKPKKEKTTRSFSFQVSLNITKTTKSDA